MTIGDPKPGSPSYWSTGQGTVAWPAGVAAGDVVWLHICGDSSGSDKREPLDSAVWDIRNKTYSTHTWSKFVDAAYLAANPSGVPCKGRIVFITATSGVGAIGMPATPTPGATMPVAGACLFVFGRGKSALTPTNGKLFSDITNPSYSNRRNNVWFRRGTAAGYLALDGTFNGTDSDGFVLIPTTGPSKPTPISPVQVAHDYTTTNTFTAVHNSNNHAAQEQIKIRVRPVSGSWSYLLANGTLTATETAISSSSASQTMNANLLTAGGYEWQAATYDTGTWSEWSDLAVWTETTTPVVTGVTFVTGAGNLTPAGSWTETVVVAQRAWEARVCLAAAANWDSPVWSSGVQSGTDLNVDMPFLADWVNGGSYKLWIQVTQQDGLKSAPVASSAQTVSWTPPSAPSSVSAANQASGPLRVTVAGVIGPVHAITNLIPNGGFQDGSTGWDTGNGMGTPDAGRMACLRTPSTQAQVRRGVTLISGHQYYAASTITGGTPGSTGMYLLGLSGSSTTGAERLSRIVTGGGALTWFEFQDGRSTGTLFYADNVVLIDLTADFGAGNEPTKAAMDSLLANWTGSWFDGSYDPAASHEVHVQTSTDAGVTWEEAASVVPTSTSVVVPIPQATYGAPALYRARSRSPFSGAPLWSGWTVTGAAVASTDPNGYLIADTDPSDYLRIEPASDPERTPVESRSVTYGLGADKAQVDSYERAGWTGSMQLLTLTYAEEQALDDWLADHLVWRLKMPPESDGSPAAKVGRPVIRASLDETDIKVARVVDGPWSPRKFTLAWVEQ